MLPRYKLLKKKINLITEVSQFTDQGSWSLTVIHQSITRFFLNLETAFQTRSTFVTGFYKIQAFVLALSNADQDGRVLHTAERASMDKQFSVTLKYQLLNPSESFRDVVTEARAVILAGGTMAPVCGSPLLLLFISLKSYVW